MGGIVGSGSSKAKKEAQWQQEQMRKQAQKAEAERQAQENVAQAQAKLAEDSMFAAQEDVLGIETQDTGEVGGKRKRKRQQDTSGGLGIG